MSRPKPLETAKAKKAFENFTGHRPVKSFAVPLDEQAVSGYRMGSLVGVAYEAIREGQRERYFHEFKKSAQPDLVARADGKQLYITRGKYKVTDRGVEDMPQLFVVNPSPRGAKRKKKVSIMAKRRKRSAPRRALFARNPVRPLRRRRRKASVIRYAANPIRRRRAVKAVRRRSFRRNPTRGLGGFALTKMLFPAIAIGAGAVGWELIMGYLPIPAQFKTGTLRHITKGAVGIAAGMIVGKFASKKIGDALALGAVVIAAHDALKEVILKMAPAAKFAGYMPAGQAAGSLGYYTPAQGVPLASMGAYVPMPRTSLGGRDMTYSSTPDFRA